MSVTFKLQSPHGLCSRITFPSAPELSALTKVAENLVQGESNRLLYRDSEGDWVLITSSSDVAEVVKDAQQAGATTVKVHVRPCSKKPQKSQPTRPRPCHIAAASPWGLSRWAWAPFYHQAPHFSRSFVSFDHGAEKDIQEMVNAVCAAFFPGTHAPNAAKDNKKDHVQPGTPNAAKDNKKDHVQPGTPEAAVAPAASESTYEAAVADAKESSNVNAGTSDGDQQNQDTSNSDEVDDKEVAQGYQASASEITANDDEEDETSDASTAPVEPAVDEDEPTVASDFVEVQVPKPEEEQEDYDHTSTENDNTMDAKVKLLRDMGFEMPADVAKTMIKEMGGRMDLIVRALVANSK